MNYAVKLARLERLKELVDEERPKTSRSGDEAKKLYQEICETYGEVADAFDAVVGRQNIEVPIASVGGPTSKYPNYFEAGYLSGRTFHTHQAYTELLRVIGTIKARVSATRPPLAEGAQGNRVFLVHGHDEAATQSCARFIEKLGLPLTVLREEPNQGRTIVEKFIDYSDVGFAVVLLTADDQGGPAGKPCDEQSPRARQNVIFELGFFIGKLGRERVCALYTEGVEVPTDYQGVAFVPLDARLAWRLELAKELRAAGLPVDLNRAV